MGFDVYKQGSRIGKDVVRVHRGGNRIDGVSHDSELFFADLPKPARSKIPLSFDSKFDMSIGRLVPILHQECVPGDTFHIAQAHNIMLGALISPMFQRIDYRTWYFFVPTRLVDDTWKDFITYKNTNYTLPYFTGKDLEDNLVNGVHSFADYMDLPVQQANFATSLRSICAHPFRAYNLIWNEYFRDEFKQSEIPIYKTGGNCISAEILSYDTCKDIGWEKDYFTTCQTSPQIGSDVSLPIGITASSSIKFIKTSSSTPSSGNAQFNGSDATFRDSSGSTLKYYTGLATTGTINDLRMANHLQRYRDRLQIAGQRYNEQILAEFGVVVPDYRIQRPEYIGGFAAPIEIGKVFNQTADANYALGSYAGRGSSLGRMDYIHYDCKEHGYIIGVCAVVPRSSYYQGIPREYIKRDIYDYYHPEFATLADQEVLNDEIFVRSGSDDSRFGYQQRYAEYKYAQDRIKGAFRTSLKFWHMGREFRTAPILNGDFVSCDDASNDNPFAVIDEPNIYCEVYQQIDAVRPMPVSVVPNLENND